jgi:hypothetical protein
MKQLLIISSTADSECDSIHRHLVKNKTSFFRLNADRFHDMYAIEIDPGHSTFKLTHRKTGASITESAVGAVWWSRYTLPGSTHQVFESHLREFIDEEYYAALIAILSCLPDIVPVLNHPVKHYIAGHKAYQQKVAVQCGFALPSQVITNRAASFLDKPWHINSVYKPISNSQYISKNKQQFFATVRKIDQPLLSAIQLKNIDLHIHHFQAQIVVKEEYRVTVFGEHVMAFRVDGAKGFDWRLYLNDLSYQLTPNFPVAQNCLAYMKSMGILFGCFDIIRSQQDEYYFLECNAPGYFLFLDPKGKYNLAKQFTEYLISLIE